MSFLCLARLRIQPAHTLRVNSATLPYQVFFVERSIGTRGPQHLVIHAIPIPNDKADEVKTAFEKEGTKSRKCLILSLSHAHTQIVSHPYLSLTRDFYHLTIFP